MILLASDYAVFLEYL